MSNFSLLQGTSVCIYLLDFVQRFLYDEFIDVEFLDQIVFIILRVLIHIANLC